MALKNVTGWRMTFLAVSMKPRKNPCCSRFSQGTSPVSRGEVGGGVSSSSFGSSKDSSRDQMSSSSFDDRGVSSSSGSVRSYLVGFGSSCPEEVVLRAGSRKEPGSRGSAGGAGTGAATGSGRSASPAPATSRTGAGSGVVGEISRNLKRLPHLGQVAMAALGGSFSSGTCRAYPQSGQTIFIRLLLGTGPFECARDLDHGSVLQKMFNG